MAVNGPTVSLNDKKIVNKLKGQPRTRKVNFAIWWTDHWRAILGELVATTVLISLGCMTCMPIDGSPATPLYSSIGFGLIVLFVAQSFGHISGSHMNPCVSIGAVILGKISIPLGIAYAIAQCSGAIIGYGLLIGLSPIDVVTDGICTNQPHVGHTIYQTLGVEIVFTAVLMLVICALWDPVIGDKTETIPIKFGLTVTALAIASGPVAGVSMNPAKTLGPAIWTGRWAAHWVYWVGPLLGGVITAVLYKLIWLKKENIKEEPILAWTEDSSDV